MQKNLFFECVTVSENPVPPLWPQKKADTPDPNAPILEMIDEEPFVYKPIMCKLSPRSLSEPPMKTQDAQKVDTDKVSSMSLGGSISE